MAIEVFMTASDQGFDSWVRVRLEEAVLSAWPSELVFPKGKRIFEAVPKFMARLGVRLRFMDQTA